MSLRVLLISNWRNLRIRALTQIAPSRHELIGIIVRREHQGVPLPDLWKKVFSRLPHGRVIAKRIFNSIQAERVSLWRAAHLNKVKVYECANINQEETLETIRTLNPDLILTMAWPKKFGATLLKLPSLGCVNCHPSLLPKHRGGFPISAALLAGDAETGVTFHYMNENYDTGDVLLQKTVAIAPRENGATLLRKCGVVALDSLLELLDGIAEGCLTPKPQNLPEDLAVLKLSPSDGLIDWHMTAQQIDCRIRALYPWVKPHTFHYDRRIEFSACEPQTETGKAVPGQVLACNAESLLIATIDAGILIKSPVVAGLDKRRSRRYFKNQIKSGEFFGVNPNTFKRLPPKSD